jgi:hypothetical protein
MSRDKQAGSCAGYATRGSGLGAGSSLQETNAERIRKNSKAFRIVRINDFLSFHIFETE